MKYVFIGAGFMSLLVIVLFFAYSMGKASIADQCTEFRAFTYAGEAWGCVRLRKKRTFDDMINETERKDQWQSQL